jgi:hypothetical protein
MYELGITLVLNQIKISLILIGNRDVHKYQLQIKTLGVTL